ncbi:DUF484 family protein [Phaeovibrio sulfidiphilus]|uniref:DUF484 family protein n=1 Tax=Phaeovibrio sulfidiphilus TaxID=1220600 RepID=A0A8J6YWA3_9PROT|nr:DUF484 family protein [Phaeovibrio sulfidiphilus]MBE1237619.1 DUF484 family protein [Phaeovibrio sulfidiphilus]
MRNGQDSATQTDASKTDATPEDAVATLDEAAVLDYLLSTPDFLLRHPDVLLNASAPRRFDESEGKVVDFQHAMLRRLQCEMEDLQNCAEELILTTRSNMDNQKSTFDATLVLLEAGSVEELVLTVSETLPLILDVDTCVLRLEDPARSGRPDHSALPRGFVDEIFDDGTEALLRPEIIGEPVLYGERGRHVRSDVLVRVDPGEGLPPAVLALGSHVSGTFHGDMSVDLVSFLAKILEHCLRRLRRTAAP